MSELSKEELIKALKQFLINCPSGSWDKGYNVAIKNSIKLAKQLSDTTKKVVVPKYIDRFIKQFDDPINEIIWNCNQEYDYCDEKELAKVISWFDKHREQFYDAVVNDYEVEQPKRWVVLHKDDENNNLYLTNVNLFRSENIGCTSNWTENHVDAINFTDKRKADLVAELIGGEVEEV